MTSVHQPDYPAAHSMDTSWFAVDAAGEVAEMDCGTENYYPLVPSLTPEYIDHPSTISLNDMTKIHLELMDRNEVVWWHFLSDEDKYDEDNLGGYAEMVDLFDVGFHKYEHLASNSTGPYGCLRSPAQPFLYEELPEEIRQKMICFKLPDVVFADREPVSAFDVTPTCYTWYPEETCEYCPDNNQDTSYRIPIPNRLGRWDEKDLLTGLDKTSVRIFFACDGQGHLGVFATTQPWTLEGQAKMHCTYSWPQFAGLLTRPLREMTREFGPGTQPAQAYDFANGRQLVCHPPMALVRQNSRPSLPIRPGYMNSQPTVVSDGQYELCILEDLSYSYQSQKLAELAAFVKEEGFARLWIDGWVRHWCEHPFLPLPPRMAGLWQYDMLWHHGGPYSRTGQPAQPLHISQVSKQWLEKVQPVHWPHVCFEQSARLQPLDWGPPPPPRPVDEYDRSQPRAQLVIDTELQNVRPAIEGGWTSPAAGWEERVLKHARRHYDLIERLLVRPAL